jgi:hypothetical protein
MDLLKPQSSMCTTHFKTLAHLSWFGWLPNFVMPDHYWLRKPSASAVDTAAPLSQLHVVNETRAADVGGDKGDRRAI